MTTIELEFTNMSSQAGGGTAPQGVKVRISQDPAGGLKTEGDLKKQSLQSPRTLRPSPASAQIRKTGFDLNSEFACYNPNVFTITAYLANEGMEGEKRLKLQCYPGMTVQEVINSQIPSVTHKPYAVYQFPSKALLNPEKEASVLQDQEIWIEPARAHSKEDIGDERLAVVKELYRTEDAYLEHLRNIFDVYMEPMRNWGIPQPEMNTLFLPLSRLCDLLMNFFSELELAVKSWNTSTTLIGGLFTQYRSYWDMYVDYAQSYTVAMKLLKQKRKDESFSKFLDIKRGAAMHTLESLMLLPVQRVSDYQRYLTQLLSLTPRDHPDYQNIRVTVARTDEIIQARADELVYLQNESKLEQVQVQFPSDQLLLFEKLEVIDATVPKRIRSISQVTPPSSKGTGTSSSGKWKTTSNSDFTDGGSSRKKLRMYIQEGPVKLLVMNKQGMFQSQDRYLFLFSDLLLIAKPANKSRMQHHRVYRLKRRLRLSEMWVSETIDAELSRHDNQSAFTIGWPITNSIALFSCASEKDLWYNSVLKHINLQRQLAVSDSVSIQTLNMTKPNNQINTSPTRLPEFLQVHISENCLTVLKNALQAFKINEPLSEFQLWVKLAKEDKEELLQGYECIFAIQSHHNRQQMDLSGDSRPQQLEFVVRRKPLQSTNPTATRQSIFKRMRFGNKSGVNLKTPKQVKMFGVPLEDLIVNNQLPEKLQEILIRLWVDGPTTSGIFRLNGNARKIREVREAIDGRKLVDLSDEGIHLVSSLLKELLRNVPGGILPSSRYTEFVATNDIEEEEGRVQQIRKVLNKLPVPNQVFLRYLLPLLYHIAQYEDINQMNTTNLAICFAPSLLEPEYSLAVIKNEAPTLVEFMIRHAMSIYNNELPELFRQAETVPSETSESEREMGGISHHYVRVKDSEGESEGMGPLNHYHKKYQHQRNLSMESTCTSASEDSLDEDDSSTGHCRLPLQHTASDSKVEELSVMTKSSSGRMTLMSDRSEGVSTGMEGDLSDTEDDEDSRMYNMSSSGKRPANRQVVTYPNRPQQRMKANTEGVVANRRRSFVPQGNSMVGIKLYTPDLQTPGGPPSPPRSKGSSHSSGSPMFPHRITDHMDSDGSRGGSGHRSDSGAGARQGHKKRRKPGHSNSFSKSSDLQHKEARLPQSTSFSYCDSVLPAESRTRSHTVASSSVASSHPISTTTRDLTASLELGKPVRAGSSQSINSRASAGSSGGGATGSQTRIGWTPQTQNSTSSLGSGNSHRSVSPDMLSELTTSTPSSKLDSEYIKQTISHRFGLTNNSNGGNSTDRSAPSESTPILKKEDENLREDTTAKVYPYQQPPSHDRMKRMESVETTSSIDDDRPEAERHLNSLPRTPDYRSQAGSLGRRGMFGPAEMTPLNYSQDSGSRQTLGSGYNSDTESSPSRTLNRPDKLQEVANSPYTIRSMPSRYSKINNDPTQTSTSSLRSNDSFERPPSIEEHTPLSMEEPALPTQPPVAQSLRTRSTTVGHDAYTDKKTPAKSRVTSPPTTSPMGVGSRAEVGGVQRTYGGFLSTHKEIGARVSDRNEPLSRITSKSFEEKDKTQQQQQPIVTAPHIGTRHLGPSLEHRSRSMPDHNKRLPARTPPASSGAHMRTERVIRYELPVPKKIRRINLRAYNTK